MTTTPTRPAETFANNDQKPARARPDAAQGGSALHPRPGQVRGRHPAARHAASRRPAITARARADREHRRQRRTGTSEGESRHHRRRSRGQGLAWMPTLSNDVQAVLATDKVRFQGQEVAVVVAEDRYSARDAPRADRCRLRPAAACRGRSDRTGSGGAGHPRRSGRQDEQPLLRLGDRRRRRH